MTEVAQNYQTTEPAATEGLEDLFDVPPIIDQGGADQTIFNSDHWNLSTAAHKLRTSVITIRRRLQKGTLKGYKIQGINGPEWRIIPPDQHTLIVEQGNSDQTPITEQGDPDQTLISPYITPDHPVIEALLKRVSEVERELAMSHKELQSAVWRNGYLESQLENERDKVKLLTDSQYQPGWWARFATWFFRGQ